MNLELTMYEPIVVSRGCASYVEFDLRDFDFKGGEVVLTIRDKDEVFTEYFGENKVYNVLIPEDVTMNLSDWARYDLTWELEGHKFAVCLPSRVVVLDSVGGEVDGN